MLEISTAPAEAIEAIRGPILAASERAEKRYPASTGQEPGAGEAWRAGDKTPANSPAATPAAPSPPVA